MIEFAEDLEKYQFYLSAKFEFFESLLFSNLVKKPSQNELKEIRAKVSKKEIERLYNHFHMSAISENIQIQRECVIEIYKKWRFFFETEMKDKNVTIEIYDTKNEVILYVYEE